MSNHIEEIGMSNHLEEIGMSTGIGIDYGMGITLTTIIVEVS